MGPFEISKEIIRGLSDELLRALLDQLLTAEARRRGISTAGIAIGGNQTAADGGIDGSIVWKGVPAPRDWLPRRDTRFQCKAEVMAPAKLREEMRPDNTPRPLFCDLVKTRGSYIVFTTDDPSQSWQAKRLAEMRAAVSDVQNHDRIHLDFYGADKIARWTNEHLGVAVWLLEKLDRPVGGWRPYGAWSAPNAEGEQYVFDATARAKVGGVHMDMHDAVEAMRSALAVPGGVVRLVGLSGMGKTRLAEALFDIRLEPASALPTARAIFGDAGLNPAVSPALLVEQLAMANVDAVIIVDNCNQRTHGQLAETVGRGASRASLITIDYDVGGEQPAGLLVVLEGNSEDVLRSVLEQRFPNLSGAERHHLAEFSGGNARIALKIAEAGGEGIDLSKLNDGELLDRLFQTDRQATPPDARICAEVASLVYAFYVSDGDGHAAEHALLARIAEVSVQSFYRNVATFLEWGVTQQRGPQRAVMPPPLANMLAAPFIRRSDPAMLINSFLAGPVRLLASFARRLGQLHDEPAAVAIVTKLFAPSGPFGTPDTLNDDLRRGFVKAAPAAPDAALAAIERALAGSGRAALVDFRNEGRADYVQLLVLIAHDPVLFARAVEALLAFACADGDAREELRARNHLVERFWPILSFTLADQAQRLSVLDRMLADPDERVVALGLEALDHMLDAGHFNSSLNLEFGARSRLTEWRPYNGDGYQPWFEAAYERVIRIGQGDGSLAQRARAIVGEHFREHLSSGFGDLALDAMQRVRGNGFWEAGWRAVNDALHFAARSAESESLVQVIALERDLRPRTGDDFFEAFVLGEPWRHWHPSGRRKHPIRNVGLLARAAGRAVCGRGEDPLPYLERSMRADGHTSVDQFALGLARHAPDLDALWDVAYRLFAAEPASSRRPAVLAGILRGARARDRAWVEAKLDSVVRDSELTDHLVVLQTAVPLDEAAVDRFRVALANGSIAPDRFTLLMMGSVTKPIPGHALASLLRQLFAHDDGILPALQVLHMRIFGDQSDKVAVNPELIALGREMLADPRVYTEEIAREDHGIADIAALALEGEGGEGAARATCQALLRSERSSRHSYLEFDELCATIMKAHPRVVLDEIVAVSDSDYLIGRFFGGWARNDEDFDPAGLRLNRDILMEWVREDPAGRAAKLANFVPYTVADSTTKELAWSSIAFELVALAPDPVSVLRTFEHRFFTGGGSGPLALRFVRRRPLISVFAKHADAQIRDWAATAGQALEANIARWDEAERDRDSRFE